MNFIKNNWQRFFFIFFSILLPVISFADTHDVTCDPTKGQICNPIPKVGSVPDLIRIILEGVLQIGIPVVALAIIYSGFLFVFARGNTEALGKAKTTLMYTLIGAAILLGSWALAQMIGHTVDALK